MKFIHTADLHLDSKIDSLPLEKSKILREEIISTFESLCLYAKKNSITAVIICGDMFDSNKITNKTFLRIINAINNAKDVDFLYLNGNHDDFSGLVEKDNLPSNLKFFTNKWTTFVYDDTAITGISFTKNNVVSYAETLSLPLTKKNIVCLHGQISGYNAKDNAELISLPKLKNKGIDYLALGHIHSFSINDFDLHGQYAYSGCLEGRGFDETGEKGFIQIEVENKKISSTFVPFSSRNFYVEDCFIDTNKNWYEFIDEYLVFLKNKYNSKSIFKINIKGELVPDYQIDIDTLQKKLNDNFFYAKVIDKTELKVKAEDYENDKSIIGEFVRAVLNENLDKETKDKILLLGLNALNKKEI